ncbi:hypothetical protein BDW69DRAFT_128017 [Aspergillus filifer]
MSMDLATIIRSSIFRPCASSPMPKHLSWSSEFCLLAPSIDTRPKLPSHYMRLLELSFWNECGGMTSFILTRRPRGGEVHTEAIETSLLAHYWMYRIRALLLLFVFASWQIDPTLVQQSFEYQGLIARCLREIGLSEHSLDVQHDWLEWARHETDRRTKLFAWCLLSLHGLAFDTPPILLARELNLFLPSTCKEWISRNEADWRKARNDAVDRAMFKQAHASHLATSDTQQLSHDPHSQSLDPSVITDFEVSLNHCIPPRKLEYHTRTQTLLLLH